MNGATIVMVTHDPRYARHAERHIYLFDGKVVPHLDMVEGLDWPHMPPPSRGGSGLSSASGARRC
jgi:hypothetical protein